LEGGEQFAVTLYGITSGDLESIKGRFGAIPIWKTLKWMEAKFPNLT